ncbi:MAG: hypothetical protein ACYTHK_15240 [Planctomycetota bacterium]|jgi:hypothetical protein
MRRKAISILAGLILAACGGGGGSGNPYTLIAFDNQGDMFQVNPSTGASTRVLDTFYRLVPSDPPQQLRQISSAVYNPVAGEIWGGAGGGNACNSCVYRFDFATGEAITIEDNAGAGLGAYPGMAVNALNEIYVHQGFGSGLYLLNNITGAAVELNDTTAGLVGNSMTVHEGTLYLAADGKFWMIDAGGVAPSYDATELGDQILSGFPFAPGTIGDIVSMTTHPTTGLVYCIFKEGAGRGGGGGSAGTTHLATVNTDTGVVTHRAQLSRILDGLAWVPTDSLK